VGSLKDKNENFSASRPIDNHAVRICKAL